MKLKILSVFILLILMALVPFGAILCKKENISTATTDNAEQTSKANTTTDEMSILCGLVTAQTEDSYSDETIKAIAILLNTDYKLKPDNFDLNNTDIFINENNTNNSLKDKYKRIEPIIQSLDNVYLYYNNENLYIPFSKCSNGFTLTDNDYNYLYSVASPWDCYSKNYSDNDCIGVSLDGLDYLCKNGATAEQALQWYLPKFNIQ
jgi:hypothetical protein